jgi:hypothetical protein
VPVDYVLSVEGSTFARGEHKSIIGPHSPSPKLAPLLDACGVASEGFYGPLRQVYGAP